MFTELKRMSKVVKCMAAGYKRGIFKLPEFSETEKVIKLNGNSHGRGGFRGMLLGSTSRALLQYAPCPMMVVRPNSR
jgi:hypothetical protein